MVEGSKGNRDIHTYIDRERLRSTERFREIQKETEKYKKRQRSTKRDREVQKEKEKYRDRRKSTV